MLLKNPRGRIVSVTQERGEYLLNPRPVLLNSKGKPRLNAEGEEIPLIKARYEEGYTKPTQAEIDAYLEKQAEDQAAAEEAAEATNAAAVAATAASMAAARAAQVGNKTTAKKGGRKSNAQKAAEQEARAEMEGKVRDAEGDKAKYDALSDEEKKLFAELGMEVPA